MTVGYQVHCRGCAREIAVNASPTVVIDSIAEHQGKYHDVPEYTPDPYVDVAAERYAQDMKWGPAIAQHQTAEKRLAILVEEVGEYAKDVCEHDADHARTELVQIAAVAIANIERIDAWLDR